jgi:hypothetical protein
MKCSFVPGSKPGEKAHEMVLKNPYAWMKENENAVIKLNSQTPEAFDAYLEKKYN